MEDIDAKRSQNTFEEIGDKHLQEKAKEALARHAQIAQRLMRIRKDIGRLDKEMKCSPHEQASGAGVPEESRK